LPKLVCYFNGWKKDNSSTKWTIIYNLCG
jgi:hypothetical protein